MNTIEAVRPGTASFLLDAPAKVNLCLHVTGRRGDGYHLIETLAVFTRLGDRLRIAASDRDAFTVEGPFAGEIPENGDNLVCRARDAFRQSHGDVGPVAITLEKHLPPASGIGGGSSDAAACFCGLAAMAAVPVGTVAPAALRIGADLPMCIAAHPLIASGIGDELRPLQRFPALPMVLVNPRVEVPTPVVFKGLSRRDNPGLPPDGTFASFDAVTEWLRATRNDLEPAAIAFAPPIGECLRALDEAGAALPRMSGSGATCFGLFATQDEADRAAEQIRGLRPSWFVAATRSYGVGEFQRMRSDH